MGVPRASKLRAQSAPGQSAKILANKPMVKRKKLWLVGSLCCSQIREGSCLVLDLRPASLSLVPMSVWHALSSLRRGGLAGKK